MELFEDSDCVRRVLGRALGISGSRNLPRGSETCLGGGIVKQPHGIHVLCMRDRFDGPVVIFAFAEAVAPRSFEVAASTGWPSDRVAAKPTDRAI